MKKPVSIFFAVVLWVILNGCYESQIPLSSSQASKIDIKLVNYWVSIPKKPGDSKILLAIFKFNENEYLITWKESNGDTMLTRGFITDIGNTRILNIQNIRTLDKKDRTFVFFKYQFDNRGNLLARILSDDNSLLKDRTFKSPEEFYAFIKKNLDNEKLFGEIVEFKRGGKFDIEIR